MNIGTNFNIANFMKNADVKQRAMVYFGDLGNLMVYFKSTLKESERDALQESFKTNSEVDVHNKYLHFFNRFQLCISDINYHLEKIAKLKLALDLVLLSQFKHGRIQDEVNFTIYKILNSDLVKKQNKKDKKNLKDLLNTMAEKIDQISIEEDLKRIQKKKGEEGGEKYVVLKYAKNIKERIEEELKFADFVQELFQETYKSLDVKFDMIEEAINQNEERVKEARRYVEDLCSGLLKDIQKEG
jgi:hypothetical protein